MSQDVHPVTATITSPMNTNDRNGRTTRYPSAKVDHRRLADNSVSSKLIMMRCQTAHGPVRVVGRLPGLVASGSGPTSILEHLKLTLQKFQKHMIFVT